MALYFYFNETTGDLVYSDQATYSGIGYTSLGQQTNVSPFYPKDWVFHSLRTKIKTVTKDANLSTKIDVLRNVLNMFSDCSNLTSLDLSGFDTSNIRNFNAMFYGCSNLAYLDLSGFNTSNATNIGGMFWNCTNLISIDLSRFDTSNVDYVNYMFNGCISLISIDLSSFDTSNVLNKDYMFVGCSALRIIDISKNMSNLLSQLPSATYYDAATRQSYAKASIPGGSTYVRDLADLDLIATMVQSRAGIKAMEHRVNSHIDWLQKQLDALTV